MCDSTLAVLAMRASVFTLALASPAAAAATTDPQLERLDERVDDLDRLVELILLPMTLLIAVLSLGGVIGIVFSIRDQRRVSQLHELAVGSELSAQRRTEQSFTAFLEGSQKTLTLVNDTLALAKEATESERHAMERKAVAGLAEVEEKAEDLVLRVAETEDFDELLDVRNNRAELERIAADLGHLEAYRRLQDIELPPYSRFVVGIEQYLDNNTRGALRTLRHSTEEASKPQLQQMSLYWSAKLHIATGEYDNARRMLARAVAEAGETRIAKLEYERLLHEVEFFEFAESHADAPPDERWKAVSGFIAALKPIAQELAKRTENDDDQHPNHEMAATLANLYMWVAYDPTHLYEPLAERLELVGPEKPDDAVALDEDELRERAVRKAQATYPAPEDLHEEQDVDFALTFGRVEADFALGTGSREAYPPLENHAIQDQRRTHREHRHTIELAQIALICEARLLHYVRANGEDDPQARRQVSDALSGVTNAVVSAPDHTVTVFSHLQRRNLAMDEFEAEARALNEQAQNWKPRKRGPSGGGNRV